MKDFNELEQRAKRRHAKRKRQWSDVDRYAKKLLRAHAKGRDVSRMQRDSDKYA